MNRIDINTNFTVVIEFKEPVKWIKFNADEVGYYRVNYEATEWDILYNILQHQHKVNFHVFLSFIRSLTSN